MSKNRKESLRCGLPGAVVLPGTKAVLILFLALMAAGPMSARARAQMPMDPFFTAINYPETKGHGMLMFLPDFQTAQQGNDFITEMGMAEYGVTSRWTVGAMAEGQKISGLPGAFGGLRFNTYFQLFPRDRWLHFTVYGEYEDLNAAALYKMEVSGFGGEDLTGPLAVAKRTAAHTFEQRAIVYHDWGRLNVTFNFISETNLQSEENDFGYAWGIYREARWMRMRMAETTPMAAPPALSLRRLGVGLEMIGALGNAHHFGFYWHREQQYVGPVFGYQISRRWSVRLEPAFGLSAVSDPLVLRVGVGCSF